MQTYSCELQTVIAFSAAFVLLPLALGLDASLHGNHGTGYMVAVEKPSKVFPEYQSPYARHVCR